MPVTGDSETPRLEVDGADATTVVTVRILDPEDGERAPTVLADAPRRIFTAPPLVFAMAGEWRFFWHIAGPGTPVGSGLRRAVYVDGDGSAARGVSPVSFATTRDLADYPAPVGPESRRRLIDATREIERITKTARYGVDARGVPTDARIRRALSDATCELVLWWDETGLETGGRALYTSASIAGVSLGMGGATTGNAQADRVGPRVWTILLGAGLVRAGAVMS